MKKILFYFLLLITILLPFWGSETPCMIILRDGSEYRGKLLEINDTLLILECPEGKRQFKKSEVHLLSCAKERQYQKVKNVSEVTDVDIHTAIQNAVTYKPKEDESIAILLDKINYEYNGKNIICRGKKIIKILNEAGKENSIRTIYYNTAGGGACELLYAITVAPDGSVVSLQDDALNNEPINENGRLYHSCRRIKFSMPNPKVGNILVYEYIWEFPADPLFFPICDYFYLRDNYYVAKREFSYRNMPFQMETFQEKGEVAGSSVKIEKSNETLTVSAKNIMRLIITEKDLPEESSFIPNVRITSCFSEAAAVKYFHSPKIETKEFYSFLVENNLQNLKTEEDLYRAYAFFQDKIIQSNYSALNQAYQFSNEHEMLLEKNLSVLDKTMLFASVLSASGIQSHFMFYSPREKEKIKIEPICNLVQYPGIAISFTFNGKEIMLSHEDPNLGFGQLPMEASLANAMIIESESINYKILPEISMERNKTIRKYEGTLDENGTLHLTRQITLDGNNADDLRNLRFYSDKEKEKYFRQQVASVKIGSRLESYKIESDLENKNIPVVFSDSITIPNYISTSGTILIFHLPEFQTDYNSFKQEKRNYTTFINKVETSQVDYSIHLPDTLKVKYLPEAQEFSFMKMKSYISYQYKENTIIVSVTSQFGSMFIQRQLYNKFMDVSNKMIHASKQAIILEKIK